MPLKAFVEGNTLVLTAEFTVLSTGALTDPTTVTFKVKPSGAAMETFVYGTDDEVEKVSTGIFTLTFVGDVVARWYARVEGTGAAAGVEELNFEVTRSKVLHD